MLRRSIIFIVTLVVILSFVVPVTDAGADDGAPSGTGAALLEALGRVPDTEAARQSLVSYLDQAALVAARPGAAQPASIGEALTLLGTDDRAASLWLAAFMGASSGDMDLFKAS